MHPKHTIPGIGLLILAVMVFLMAGCSDDDNPLPSTGEVNGSLDDPEFVLIQEQIDAFLGETEEMLILGLENTYQLPIDTEYIRNIYGPMGPDDIVEYNYADGWHVTYIAHFNSYANDYFRDSVMFQVNSQPVQDPDNLEWMQYIRHWGYTSNLVDVTHTNKNGYVNLEFENLDQDIATINGVNNTLWEWNYYSNDSTIEAVYDVEMNIVELQVGQVPTYGWISGCPYGGNLAMSIEQAYSVNYGDDNDFWVRNWNVWITFDDGMADIRINSENEVWNYQCEFCSPPVY